MNRLMWRRGVNPLVAPNGLAAAFVQRERRDVEAFRGGLVGQTEESTLEDTFYFSWGSPPGRWQIELKALRRLKHGDTPPEPRLQSG